MATPSEIPEGNQNAEVAATPSSIPRKTVPPASTGSLAPVTSTVPSSKASSITAVNTNTTKENDANSVDPTADFVGEVNTNNEIPTQETLKKIQDYTVLDGEGKSLPFRHIYSGPNVARRVLVIFIRHFFCGICQEYIRSLTASITPQSLLSLSTPTFIAIIGCGSPTLISMYADVTSCPFPIYADPTKRLYSELGMTKTLNMSLTRPDYQRKHQFVMTVQSVVQGIKTLGKGKAFKGGSWAGGDMQQVGGEFLFEPVDFTSSPVQSPNTPPVNLEKNTDNGYLQSGFRDEEKHITWCHRMKNTRDHAELPELREVLGLDGFGVGGHNQKRWTRALEQRKGTGLSGKTAKSVKSFSTGSD